MHGSTLLYLNFRRALLESLGISWGLLESLGVSRGLQLQTPKKLPKQCYLLHRSHLALQNHNSKPHPEPLALQNPSSKPHPEPLVLQNHSSKPHPEPLAVQNLSSKRPNNAIIQQCKVAMLPSWPPAPTMQQYSTTTMQGWIVAVLTTSPNNI